MASVTASSVETSAIPIEFASAGSYQLRLEPVSQLLLPQTETITVT